jgi:hypothetical protein
MAELGAAMPAVVLEPKHQQTLDALKATANQPFDQHLRGCGIAHLAPGTGMPLSSTLEACDPAVAADRCDGTGRR